MSFLSLKNVSKQYGDSLAVQDFNLNVEKGDGFFPYRKMQKMGLPLPAIIHKMMMDGLSKEEQDAFSREYEENKDWEAVGAEEEESKSFVCLFLCFPANALEWGSREYLYRFGSSREGFRIFDG